MATTLTGTKFKIANINENMSADTLSQVLNEVVETSLQHLESIWNEIGFAADQRSERCNSVLRHVESLFEEMVQQETDVKDSLIGKITDIKEKLKVLSKELAVSVYEPDSKQTMLQCRKDLLHHLETLTKQKHTRMVALKNLIDQEKILCDRTKILPFHISHSTVPSDNDLSEYEKHIEELTIEQNKRFATFTIIREQIQEVFKQIDDSPSTVFERQALADDENDFILSSENMTALNNLQIEVIERKAKAEEKLLAMKNRLNVLWQRLETPAETREEFWEKHESLKQENLKTVSEEILRLEALKHTQMEKVVTSMKRELERWWKVCFTPNELRDKCSAYKTEGVFTDEIADALEAEINNLQAFYERHKNLYSQVKQWEEILEEYTVLEKKATDPNRFNNRGGALLQEEKARKRIIKELPKLEANLQELINNWEEEQKLKFSIYGMEFSEYVSQRYKTIHDEKEREKEQRQKTRALQMESDIKFGTKPAITPKKRGARMPVTPSMLAMNKTRRIIAGVRTPLSVTRINTTNMNVTTKSVTPRRKSNRYRPWDKNADRTNKLLHKTIRGGVQKDASFGSTGSYNEFAKTLNSVERMNYRSSIIEPAQSACPAKSKLTPISQSVSHTPKSKLANAPRMPAHTPMSTRL
ncbi:protein regulator of cytokinesis 1 isoform X2 [Octopus bimaculoides]|uniref:Protein regulator of cytokinesis 1 n=1 Tax=Octopus bimaculoides TaxID=37653 RepID=A0A0L8FX44_OCTBM|nr:protein regulator of cytokinesis 1 isoform X2 [Octopus bimaculoides]|eukprot:XP_014786191.1 PREDICTED: protein regulator of cytokinesis 1-like isoform X2 [Octopus bimaculoides]